MTPMKRFNNFLRTTLFGGAIVVLPLTIFILLAKLVFDFLRSIIAPISDLIKLPYITSHVLTDLITLALIIVFFFLVGLFVQTRLGKGIVSLVENELFNRLPLYGTIKETVLQFTGAKKMPFSQVVLVEPYGNNTKMYGFIADEHDNGKFTVFVPTAPNPTNGFIFYLESNQVQFVDVKPEDAIRMIIGIGTGASKLF
ncbi:MAG: DUF502 domain-containing protein [Saprospirales bacterium]|nr:DUF502 domain-containing protein [Saprospirales bacterium]MBK8490186.1 DUF502 domain-containing protein [Saprospirales bacterium]